MTSRGVSKTWGRPLACPGLIDLADQPVDEIGVA